MNLNPIPLSAESQQQKYKTRLWICILAALIFTSIELVVLWMSGNRQIWAVLPVFLAIPVAYQLNRTDRQLQGTVTLLGAINLQFILVQFAQQGLSLMNSGLTLAVVGLICWIALPREYLGRAFISALVTLVLSFLIDRFVFGESAYSQGGFNWGRSVFLFVLLVAFIVFVARGFLSLDIRTKIVTGILGTGGLALAVLTFFILNQTDKVTNALETRLEASVAQLAEEQLRNTAFTQANQANQTFEEIAHQVASLAHNWSSLQNHKATLNQSPYWDARTELTLLKYGQYGNSATDPSSAYVPPGIPLTDSLIADLNTSAYLDFYAPDILRTNPSLLAVYAIDTKGVTRYYPNINLAGVVPEGFNPSTREYYTITTPLFNPQHLSKWAIPYVDATGGGLVVTVTAPVYEGDQFIGIVAADMQLTGITKQINSIQVGQTGFAYLIDDAGRILSMPETGLKMFGLSPEELNKEEFYKQTILGRGSEDMQSVTKRMTSGGNGLIIANVNGVDTYISFAHIPTNGYSVALVVPVSELQGAIIAAQNQTM